VKELRIDEQAGEADLSLLASIPPTVLGNMTFRTTSGLWYRLTPLEETCLIGDSVYSAELSFDPSARINGGLKEESLLALKAVRNWAHERRHFPRFGTVALANTVIHKGEPLTINGRDTSPTDVAWITELTSDPAEIAECFYATVNLETHEAVGHKNIRVF